MKKEMEDIIVILGSPFSLYPEQPKDQSKSELVNCPTCNNKMWFSKNKKSLKKLAEKLGKEIIHECYICFEQRVKENPEIMQNHVKINL